MSTKKEIKQLSFGFLFKNQFKLLDDWGKIVDNILYHSEEFPSKFFPNITELYTTSRSLYSNNGDELRLNANNLIFTQIILENEDFSSARITFINRINYLLKNIVIQYGLIMHRIGIVYACLIDEKEIEKLSEKCFTTSFKEVRDFRFSLKEGLNGEQYDEKKDFINKIYTSGRILQNKFYNKYAISYDYQKHFVKPRADVRNEIMPFMESSYKNFMIDIYKAGNKNE